MLKTSELCIAEIPLRVRLGRICLEFMTFMFMLILSFLTLYFTDEMIEKGKSIPYIWVIFMILMCVAIHVFQKITGAMVLCGKVKGYYGHQKSDLL